MSGDTVASTAPSQGAARAGEPLVEVRDLVKHFPLTRGIVFRRRIGEVRAVDGVSFDVLARRDARHRGRERAAASRRRRACCCG